MKKTIIFYKQTKKLYGLISLTGGLCFLSILIFPQKTWAIPAWSRKYSTKCNMCHQPNVPRLNVVGHTFRKLGFRLEDEVGENPDYKEIGEYISIRGRLRYEYENPDNTESSNEFNFHDVTLFYAGPVTKNLTGFFELEVEDEDETKAVAYISWLMGTADRYLNIRAGQFHTITRVGWAGFDRPSGISSSNVFGKLTSTPVPFKISEDQQGLELALGITGDIRLIGQVLNGVNFEGEGSWTSDDDKDKDFLLAYEHILDERGSGFTLYGYRGVWHQNPEAKDENDTDIFPNPNYVNDDENEFEFYRYGATASALFDIFKQGYSEVLGGAILSRDNVPSDHPTAKNDIDGQAYFVEIEQYFTDASVFARADLINPDTDNDKWENKYMIGSAYMANDYLRLAGEGFIVDKGTKGADSVGFVLEAMFNF